MIIDLPRFIDAERPYWDELEQRLDYLAAQDRQLNLAEIRHLHYLYQRTAADLGRLVTFAAEPETRRYLETLVARAYAEIHGSHQQRGKFRPLHWFFGTFPRTVRHRWRALACALSAVTIGLVFGLLAIAFDADAKDVLMPFSHLQGDPSERVAQEEAIDHNHMRGHRAQFASQLMTHNTKVAINAIALGFSWGIGTLVLLFYNGVIIGAVTIDYILAGEAVFLAGWLLPHGSVEIPAFILAGQAGLVLAGAIIGWGNQRRLRERLRASAPDIVTLIGGVALILVWAGIIESFFSQYHEPLLLYAVKIIFGVIQLLVFLAWLSLCGSKEPADA